MKWNGVSTGQIIGSIGEDLKLKVWQEDEMQAHNGGRRFKCIFSQSAAHQVNYVSLDFKNIHHESYLALVTRDGLVSLSEPTRQDFFDDWKELDQFWVAGGRIARGRETSFKVSFQHSSRPNYNAIVAGLSDNALSLAVVSMEAVKLYRIIKPEDNSYRFQSPVIELNGPRGLVRDVAWSPASWMVNDVIATAANDGYVRIYEVFTPRTESKTITIKGPVNNPPEFASPPSSTYTRAPSGIATSLAGASRSLSNVNLDGNNDGQILHDWKMIDEIKQEGVWRVEWVRNGLSHWLVSLFLNISDCGTGNMLVTTGDVGKVHLWRKGLNGKWMEFADLGPETSDNN